MARITLATEYPTQTQLADISVCLGSAVILRINAIALVGDYLCHSNNGLKLAVLYLQTFSFFCKQETRHSITDS